MVMGQVLFLNGASSSGKSSIAKALQTMIDEPCNHLCIDDYLSAYQRDLWERQEVVKPAWPNIIRGFHAAGAAIARAGNMVVIDDVLEPDPPWVESLIDLFEGIDILFVGVHCPLDELERREQSRKDRRAGMARLQYEAVHAQALYDLDVDTSVLSPTQCADRILKMLRQGPHPSAFERLCQRHRRGSS